MVFLDGLGRAVRVPFLMLVMFTRNRKMRVDVYWHDLMGLVAAPRKSA